MARPKKARLKPKTKPARNRKFLAVKKIKIKPKKIKIKKNIKKRNKARKTVGTAGKSVRKKINPSKKSSRAKKTKKAVLIRAKKTAVKNKSKKKIKRKIVKAIRPKITKKIILRKKTNKILPDKEVLNSPEESLFKAKIRVVGIGGGGGSIVSEIGRSLEKASFVIADTDIRALKKRSGTKYFWFGENLTRGLGTGANPELAKRAAGEAKEKMGSILKDQDILIFIASLGGGLGSGATQVFAQAAKDFGGITFGIFTMPFKFEGKNKHKIAQNALKTLKPLLNVSLVIPNEKIFKIIDANTPITEAFSIVNKSLTGSLESLIDLIYNPGVINIDFADLRTILRGRGNMSFLNTIEESGKDRAEKICQKVLFNPLLQSNKFQAEKILFNISGSNNLSMFEVEKISRYIADSNLSAKIIFGISKNQKLKNKIKTTILMTGAGTEDKFAEDWSETSRAEKELKPDKAEELKLDKLPQKIEIINKKHKKSQTKKPVRKKPGNDAGGSKNGKKQEEILVPVFGSMPIPADLSAAGGKKLSVVEASPESYKNLPAGRHGAIRRSGLEIKKAQEQEEKKRMAQEKEWEIPAFLRRVKFNK